MATRGEVPGPGKAFVLGGAGCVVAFFVLGGACAAIGGSFYIDGGGAAFLFVLGGIFGLTATWFYRRGRASARGPYDPPPPPDPNRPPF